MGLFWRGFDHPIPCCGRTRYRAAGSGFSAARDEKYVMMGCENSYQVT